MGRRRCTIPEYATRECTDGSERRAGLASSVCVFRPIHVVVRIAVVRREPERTKASGFTLIEILVVVAIIALLVSILMPTLRHAREQGRSVVCETQMRELAKGAMYYAQVYDQRLPHFGWYDWNQSGDQWWITQLARMLNNQYDVYICPSDKDPYSSDPVSVKGGTLRMDPEGVPMDLSYRSACESLEAFPGGYRPRKITSWKQPSYALLLMEANMNVRQSINRGCFRLREDVWDFLVDQKAYRGWGEVKWERYAWQKYAYWQDDQGRRRELLKTLERHHGRSNFLFLDGHVGSHLPLEALRIALRQDYMPAEHEQ